MVEYLDGGSKTGNNRFPFEEVLFGYLCGWRKVNVGTGGKLHQEGIKEQRGCNSIRLKVDEMDQAQQVMEYRIE